MPNYTLHYFNIRGRGQLIRMIFHQAGVEFTDHRIEMHEWAEQKKNTRIFPFGVAPTLEVDRKVLPQSFAIARFLGNEFGLNGTTNWDKAVCDVIGDTMNELNEGTAPFLPYHYSEPDESKREAKKKEYLNTTLPKCFKVLEDILRSNNDGNGFFVGEQVTWADLAFYSQTEALLRIDEHCLDNFRLLGALFKRIADLSELKKFLESRPDSVL